jgi:hypothetical protein
MIAKYCLNCNSKLNGQFCSNCGQSSETKKINFHYLWHDIQHGLLHFDKGILYTTKELFTRPGNSIREFLNGKRVNHFKPISLVIILAGIYSLLSHFFELNLLSNYYELNGSGKGTEHLKSVMDSLSNWISNHYSILSLIQIPIFSLGTYICFKQVKYNYIEHLIINSFISAQKLILHIATFPIYYWLNKTSLSKPIDQSIDMIGFAIAFWTIFRLFNGIHTLPRFWRTLLSLLIPFIVIIILTLLIFFTFIKEFS